MEMKEWEEYFVRLLEGSTEDKRSGAERRKTEEDEETEIQDEEIEKQIKKIKRKKAAGIDGITGEAWKFSKGKIKRKLNEMVKRIWRGEGFPEEWREGIITPIYKKGDEKKETYRGVTLLCTAYNIYAGILAERLREEVEEKKVLPETQAGFRKARGTMDNICVTTYSEERAEGKGRKDVWILHRSEGSI